MRPWIAVAAAAVATGCASAPASLPKAPPPEAPVPDLLLGIPFPVVVERAIFDLESGDPARAARARSVLLAAPAGPSVEPLLLRFHGAPRESAVRLDVLAILAERGELPADCDAAELVEMSLREIESRDPSGRPTLLAAARLRALGEAARGPLRDEARRGGARSALAASVLRGLYGEETPPATAQP